MIHTIEQHLATFVNHYLPSGKAFAAKQVIGSNLRLLCEGMVSEFLNAEISLEEFQIEMMPDTTNEYINYWERAVGIPDHCFRVAETIEDRRANIKRKLSLLGLQTSADFEGFATGMGLDIKVRSGVDHLATNGGYGTEFPALDYATYFGSSIKTARHTIVVTSLTAVNAFPYTFDFPFEAPEQALMECVFKHAKPANCNIIFTSLG